MSDVFEIIVPKAGCSAQCTVGRWVDIDRFSTIAGSTLLDKYYNDHYNANKIKRWRFTE
jgi:hypothetical protein